ncbi:MAG: cytochrome c3 family protein [Acidobacteria bacterium]|nr:cytochrome c3 family protein [Acidobacteriota bacterium]
MGQIFHPSTNTISRLSLYGAVFIAAIVAYAAYRVNQSPYITEVNVAVQQPVPFSHKHHVTELGIDCRYCHSTVETSAFAGIPPTHTCMTCHSQIWRSADMLEPVRASYRTDQSLAWTRVNSVPDFVYFDHSIHVKKGVGCTTCHGPIGEMPLTWRAETLYMRWCLDCHRAPERYIRRREDVFKADYKPPSNQLELGRKLVVEYNIKPVKLLEDCYTCHR